MEKGKNPMLSQHDQIDRSKVQILLCDINAESCQEVLALLCKCSYQVAAVWSAGEVFDTLNSQGPRADIILATVDFLMANDANILRYIMCKKILQHIPVIILTTRDQLSVTVKGLRLGAADYLVKPLLEDEECRCGKGSSCECVKVFSFSGRIGRMFTVYSCICRLTRSINLKS